MARYKTEDLIKLLSDRINGNHKELDTRLDTIEKVLISQESNLQLHMKRSDTLEALYINLEEKQNQDLAPIKKHMSQVEGAMKLLGVISLLLGVVSGFLKLFGFI